MSTTAAFSDTTAIDVCLVDGSVCVCLEWGWGGAYCLLTPALHFVFLKQLGLRRVFQFTSESREQSNQWKHLDSLPPQTIHSAGKLWPLSAVMLMES